ncbi:RcnB family protein [Sphingomonas sp. RB3P16]|uniref:RcnB family protein n=1 Tax=Parasphingomonas frigoris TaxID=3096163 RepID=UPI002FC5BE24
MRTLAVAALTMVTAFSASGAEAQRLGHGGSYPGTTYPAPGAGGQMLPPPQMPQPAPNMPRPTMQRPPMAQGGQTYPGSRPGQRPDHHRWGGMAGGRWQGGSNAPGGWNAYRRPSRGYHVPRYWNSPSFYLGDYAGYGLGAPPQGYGWYRYYDDAVLLDSRGQVFDSVNGVDWDGGYDDGYGYGAESYGSAYAQGGGYARGYPPQYAPQYPALPPVVQNGNVTTYTTSSGYVPGGYYGGATTTVVTIQAPPTITTTTTEYIEESTRTVVPRRIYRAKKRYYRPVRRKCACQVERPVLGS